MLFSGLSPQILIIHIITLIIAISVHEFSHAFIADRLGDDLPRSQGRLTLNPLAHLDPLGSIMLIIVGFGWGRPVMVNPYAVNRRTPAGMMWVSLAGPMSNFLMAILAAIPIRLDLVPVQMNSDSIIPTFYAFLFYFIIVNLSLMLFNLIPIAPLDGEKIATYVFPPALSKLVASISRYGPIILLLVIFVGPRLGFDLLGTVISPVLTKLVSLLIG